MVKQNTKDENTKIVLSLKNIIIYVFGIISTCASIGYTIGYYKASLDAELKVIKLNLEHQHEISELKEIENQLRIEIASYKNKSVEDAISIIKYIKKNEENN